MDITELLLMVINESETKKKNKKQLTKHEKEKQHYNREEKNEKGRNSNMDIIERRNYKQNRIVSQEEKDRHDLFEIMRPIHAHNRKGKTRCIYI